MRQGRLWKNWGRASYQKATLNPVRQKVSYAVGISAGNHCKPCHQQPGMLCQIDKSIFSLVFIPFSTFGCQATYIHGLGLMVSFMTLPHSTYQNPSKCAFFGVLSQIKLCQRLYLCKNFLSCAYGLSFSFHHPTAKSSSLFHLSWYLLPMIDQIAIANFFF